MTCTTSVTMVSSYQPFDKYAESHTKGTKIMTKKSPQEGTPNQILKTKSSDTPLAAGVSSGQPP